jgi:hypothetical protein
MSFAKLQTSGRGTLRLRLMVEGWPIQWVTDQSITAADNLDGRTVHAGLSFRGLEIGDRVLLKEAKIEARALTFRIVPPHRTPASATDPLLASLSLIPDEVAELGADLSSGGTTITLDGGITLSNDTVYHIGTEAIRCTTWPTIERHIWDTGEQAHNISSFDQSRAVRVYEAPPTMEGRRCHLYAYGRDDEEDGDGQCIWRGKVARSPRLDTDGVTWTIETLPITHVLRQTVAGGFGEAAPIGFYHHQLCAARFAVRVPTDALYGPYFYSGFDANEESLAESLDAMLAAGLTASGLTEIDSIVLGFTDVGPRLVLTANTTVPPFWLDFGSPLLGYVKTRDSKWENASTGAIVAGSGSFDQLTAGEWYSDVFGDTLGEAPYAGVPSYALGDAGVPLLRERTTDPEPDREWPPWRLYLDVSLEGARAVRIAGFSGRWAIAEAETFEIALADTEDVDGTDRHFIDLVPPGVEYFGYLSSQPEATVTVRRSYGSDGTVADFVQELKNEAIFANDGDTPWVTDEDLSEWAADPGVSYDLARRRYIFTNELVLENILSEELKLVGYFMRLESDGKIGVAALPLPTESSPTASSHTITTDSAVTPRGQIVPAFEPARDGVLTTVTIQQVYDPIANEWTGEPAVFDNPDAIATHKARGRAQMEIKPYSQPSSAHTQSGRVRLLEDGLRIVAGRYLTFFGRDYVVITVGVSWKHFGVLCGDVVTLTHSLLPAGDGTRGLVGRACVCVGRTWNLAPGESERMGTLELWMPSQPVYGYAPSGAITDQTDQGGDEWDLELDAANDDNVRWSTSGDGLVLQRFAVGDHIRVVQRDSSTSPEETGVVTAVDVNAGTCTVELDGTWTPGSDAWLLEYREDDTGSRATASQRKSVYVADSAGALPDGGRGRKLS